MNILEILKELYTNTKCGWIQTLEDNEIQPYVIQRWLAMNDSVRVQTRWLDKYVFVLPSKMYLSLAWSIIPKTNRMPFIKYIKQVDEIEEFDFILTKVRKHLELSDNDYNSIKERLVNEIKKDMVNWFSYYGIKKKFWKQYYLNFKQIKDFGDRKGPSQKGLAAFGL